MEGGFNLFWRVVCKTFKQLEITMRRNNRREKSVLRMKHPERQEGRTRPRMHRWEEGEEGCSLGSFGFLSRRVRNFPCNDFSF